MIEDFIAIGIQPKSTTKQQKLKCPKCTATRKNKSDLPLAINLELGLYNCHPERLMFNVPTPQKHNKMQLLLKILSLFAPQATIKKS